MNTIANIFVITLIFHVSTSVPHPGFFDRISKSVAKSSDTLGRGVNELKSAVKEVAIDIGEVTSGAFNGVSTSANVLESSTKTAIDTIFNRTSSNGQVIGSSITNSLPNIKSPSIANEKSTSSASSANEPTIVNKQSQEFVNAVFDKDTSSVDDSNQTTNLINDDPTMLVEALKPSDEGTKVSTNVVNNGDTEEDQTDDDDNGTEKDTKSNENSIISENDPEKPEASKTFSEDVSENKSTSHYLTYPVFVVKATSVNELEKLDLSQIISQFTNPEMMSQFTQRFIQ